MARKLRWLSLVMCFNAAQAVVVLGRRTGKGRRGVPGRLMDVAMQLESVTYVGPTLSDVALLDRLPANLAGLLRQVNGFIQFHGGLHVRGACYEPDWHSLRDAWDGEAAFWRLYPEVDQADVPFAEDCMGDQFVLRDGVVYKLSAETGEVESLGVDLRGFFEAVKADPVEYLSLHPLLEHQQDGGGLEPGQLLAAFPPFCFKESADGVSLAAISASERRRFLADLSAQLRGGPDGGKIDFRVADSLDVDRAPK